MLGQLPWRGLQQWLWCSEHAKEPHHESAAPAAAVCQAGKAHWGVVQSRCCRKVRLCMQSHARRMPDVLQLTSTNLHLFEAWVSDTASIVVPACAVRTFPVVKWLSLAGWHTALPAASYCYSRSNALTTFYHTDQQVLNKSVLKLHATTVATTPAMPSSLPASFQGQFVNYGHFACLVIAHYRSLPTCIHAMPSTCYQLRSVAWYASTLKGYIGNHVETCVRMCHRVCPLQRVRVALHLPRLATVQQSVVLVHTVARSKLIHSTTTACFPAYAHLMLCAQQNLAATAR